MEMPTIKATGKNAASNKYNGEQMHSLNARLAPDCFEFSVLSRDRWMIVAIVAVLVLGFSGTIIALTLILR
jgi:hypothetical protein